MKTLGNLVVIFLVILGTLALIPLAATGAGIVLSIFCLALWFLPFGSLQTPRRQRDSRKSPGSWP